MTPRRTLMRASLAAGLAAVPSLARPALAQATWPERPVRMTIPFPPAGSVDVLARILCERLGQHFGQTFVLENRSGAGGNIGMDVVAKAPPDGYAWAAGTIGHFSINQYLYARMPWDIDRDFVAVSLMWELPNVFVASSNHVPSRTVADFVT